MDLFEFAAFFPCFEGEILVKYACRVSLSECLRYHCGAQGYADAYAQKKSPLHNLLRPAGFDRCRRGFESRRMRLQHIPWFGYCRKRQRSYFRFSDYSVQAMLPLPCPVTDTVYQAYGPKVSFPPICATAQVFGRNGSMSNCNRILKPRGGIL